MGVCVGGMCMGMCVCVCVCSERESEKERRRRMRVSEIDRYTDRERRSDAGR